LLDFSLFSEGKIPQKKRILRLSEKTIGVNGKTGWIASWSLP